MRRAAAAAAVFLAAVAASSAATAQGCPSSQSSPNFTAGGTVFGRLADQWNQYFRAKADANNGTLCNPTIVGGSVEISNVVTSVGLLVPGGGILSVTGSPVTSSGSFSLVLSGTSGGVPYFSDLDTLSSSGALSLSEPVIGGGAGGAPSVGSRSGNTTKFATMSGSIVTGNVAISDASGNLIDGGSPAGTGISQLTGDVTAGPGSGSQAATLAASGVSAGSYTLTNLTLDAKGRATAASSYAGTSCTNQFPRSLSAAGVATCATVANADLANSSVTFAGKTASLGGSATIACADLSDDGAGCTAGAASTSTAGIAKLHNVPVAVGWPAALNPNNVVIANINQASTISAIVGTVEVAVGGAATVTVNKASSGTACSAGTALHSGSFNANGTAATNQTLTVTVSSLAVGDRLCLQTTGTTTWTTGSGVGTITVFLAPS